MMAKKISDNDRLSLHMAVSELRVAYMSLLVRGHDRIAEDLLVDPILRLEAFFKNTEGDGYFDKVTQARRAAGQSTEFKVGHAAR